MAEIQPNWGQIYADGRGQAHVWQGNPGLDDLNKRYATQQQQQATNVADFTKELAKLNFNGSRDADMPVLHNDYGNILKTFQQYRSETDPKKQQALNLQMRQMQNEFLYKAQQSKQENDEYHKDAALAHNPNVDLDDSFWKDMPERAKVSTFDPKYNDFKNKQYLVPKSDPIKDAQEIVKNISGTTTTTEQRYNRATGRMENVATTATEIPQDKFMKAWVQSHTGDPNKVKTAIRETGIQDPAQAVLVQGQRMYDAVSGGGKNSQKVTGAGMTMGNLEALQANAARLRSLYPTFGQAQNLTPIYRQKWVNDMLTGVHDSGEALKAKLAADPTYDGTLDIGKHPDGKLEFNVPPKREWDATNQEWKQKAPARKVIIDPKDPNAKVKLNELTNELTGEKVDISALQTQGGKKHVLQVQSEAEYNKLPKGTQYIGPDGKTYIKK